MLLPRLNVIVRTLRLISLSSTIKTCRPFSRGSGDRKGYSDKLSLTAGGDSKALAMAKTSARELPRLDSDAESRKDPSGLSLGTSTPSLSSAWKILRGMSLGIVSPTESDIGTLVR